MSDITLYDVGLSGHAHRPRAMLKLLNLAFDSIEVDMQNAQHKSDEFLQMNPLGQVPVLVDDGVAIRESTAILVYLARRYDTEGKWLPSDPVIAAQVQSWLAVSTKEVFEGPCAARLNKVFGMPFDHPKAVAASYRVFDTLFEPHLGSQDWLVGEQATIADVANYGYIAACYEGEVSLENYPNIRAWLARVEALPGFEKMIPAASVLG